MSTTLKTPTVAFALLASVLLAGPVAAATVSPALASRLALEAQARIIVYFEPAEPASHTGDRTREDVIRRLQRNLDRTRRILVQDMGFVQESKIRSMNWISNSISMTADRTMVEALARHPGVTRILWDEPVSPMPTVPATTDRAQADPYTYGLAKLRIPEVRDVFGLTGAGVRIGNIDTGADGDHPDLAGRIKLYKDLSGQTTEPFDDHGHGTHTAATMVGGSSSGTSIGVAPDADLLVARGIAGDSVLTNLLNAMQWMLDPDGDPATNDMPVAVSMSWHTGGGDQAPFYEALDTYGSVGVIPNFSAGNSGTSGLTHPKEHPATFAVGATDSSDVVADFSSRGPAQYQGQEQKKPEWSCPGVDVYSAKPGGGYQTMSGTSMAAPHSAGVIALLFQADPTLTASQVKEILQQTAIDLGSEGWDGSYGAGRVDAFAAVSLVASGGKILGSVMTAGGDPVAGARVEIQERNFSIRTREDGSFKLVLPAGDYTLNVSAFGFVSQSRQVTLDVDEEERVDVVLASAAHHDLAGRVTGNGQGVKARITVVGTPVAPVESDDGGHFTVSLPAGSYKLQVTAFGFQVALADVTVPGPAVTFDLEPLPPVLLVDDDAGKGYESFYKAALEALGKDYGVLDLAGGEVDSTTLLPYQTVVWFTGDDYRDTLSEAEQGHLKAYLENGGTLIISSAELGYHLKTAPFYTDVIKAEFVKDTAGSKAVTGLGLSFSIEGGTGANNQRYPDVIKARAGAELTFQYGGSEGAGLQVGRSIAYLAFGLEGVDTAENRAALLGKLFATLEGDDQADTTTPASRGVRRLGLYRSMMD